MSRETNATLALLCGAVSAGGAVFNAMTGHPPMAALLTGTAYLCGLVWLTTSAGDRR